MLNKERQWSSMDAGDGRGVKKVYFACSSELTSWQPGDGIVSRLVNICTRNSYMRGARGKVGTSYPCWSNSRGWKKIRSGAICIFMHKRSSSVNNLLLAVHGTLGFTLECFSSTLSHSHWNANTLVLLNRCSSNQSDWRVLLDF